MSWELSKENIQPLPQGRKMSDLQAALKNRHSEKEILAAKRHEFEIELRAYDGDDPLDVWYRYISWVQQNYPSSGKESGLQELFQKATLHFQSVYKYKNDERYVQLCIAYANMSDYAFEIFSFMHQHNIGLQTALFYKTWAWHLENIGNSKKADAILNEGIFRRAQPLNELVAYHQSFQERMAKKSCEDATEDNFCDPGNEAQRKALGELKARGKIGRAPVNRVGSSVLQQCTRPINNTNAQITPANKKKNQIVVFEDENYTKKGFGQNYMCESKSCAVPGSFEATKENVSKPGPWNLMRLKTKVKPSLCGSGMPVTSVTPAPAQPVQVYIDEDGQDIPAKAKPSFTTAFREVKVKKSLPFISEPFDPTKRPMYAKWKVYGGPEELSFEELRAHKVTVRENRKTRSPNSRIEELKKELQQLEFAKESADFKIVKSGCKMPRANQDLKATNEVGQDQRSIIVTEPSKDKPIKMAFPPSEDYGMQVKEPHAVHLHSDQKMMDFEECLQLKRNNKLTLGQPDLPSKFPLVMEAVKRDDGQQTTMMPSANLSQLPHESKSISSQAKEQGHRLSFQYVAERANKHGGEEIVEDLQPTFGSLDAQLQPSELQSSAKTVNKINNLNNTADLSVSKVGSDSCLGPGADMSMIRNLWNAPLGESAGQTSDDDDDPRTEDVTYFKPAPVVSKIPIYMDDDEVKVDRNPYFNYDDEDKENCRPFGVSPAPKVKRKTTGILQPSADFEIVEDEAAAEEEHDEQRQQVLFGAPAKTPDHRMSHIPLNPHSVSTEQVCQNPGPLSSTRIAIDQQPRHLDLSIILEASDECYSKSSLSSSNSSGPITNSNCSSLGTSRSHFSNVTTRGRDPLFNTIREDEVSQFNITKAETLPKFKDITDPFSDILIDALLCETKPCLDTRSGYHRVRKEMSLHLKDATYVNGCACNIKEMIGEGSYAKVYTAQRDGSKDLCVLKIQKPACYWEFYICSEIRYRLEGCCNEENVLSSFAHVDDACFYNDASILCMSYSPHGTLLDFCNNFRSANNLTTEFAIYLIIQILYILENLHSCEIIHGDFKPDNILVSSIPLPEDINAKMFDSDRKLHLQLIDFGRSIDMKLMPDGTTFTKVVTTENLTCTEMKENRPWTYQIDLYGFLVTCHILLFHKYMEVINKNGRWNQTCKLRRYWAGSNILQEMFTSLLNIPDCESIPDIKSYRLRLEKVLCEKNALQQLSQFVRSLKNLTS